MSKPSTTAAAARIVARLTARGWTAEQIHRLARNAMVRLAERDQAGAHLWGLVRGAVR